MAKDPCVLFYVQDFLVGTSLLNPSQKGHYITLLCHQQQSKTGSLKDSEIQSYMGKDYKKMWPAISGKFKNDENGFYNERMRNEIARRQKNSKIQKDKIDQYWQKVKQQNIPQNDLQNKQQNNNGNTIYETEIEIETRKGGAGEKQNWNTMPSEKELKLQLPTVKIGAVIELFSITKGMKSEETQILSLWEIFKIQNFTGKKYYADESDTHSHFLNWCKTQNVNKILPEIKATDNNAREKKAMRIINN